MKWACHQVIEHDQTDQNRAHPMDRDACPGNRIVFVTGKWTFTPGKHSILVGSSGPHFTCTSYHIKSSIDCQKPKYEDENRFDDHWFYALRSVILRGIITRNLHA